jgi:hypothetical protein
LTLPTVPDDVQTMSPAPIANTSPSRSSVGPEHSGTTMSWSSDRNTPRFGLEATASTSITTGLAGRPSATWICSARMKYCTRPSPRPVRAMRPTSPGRRPGRPLIVVPIACETEYQIVRWFVPAAPAAGIRSSSASIEPNSAGSQYASSLSSSPACVWKQLRGANFSASCGHGTDRSSTTSFG